VPQPFSVFNGFSQPIAAAAIHDGHDLRPEVNELIALDDQERLREEDPFTERWTRSVDTRLVGHRSRFECDLNRPRDRAVYRVPEDAWGLNVWRIDPPEEMISRSLELYDAFYDAAAETLDGLQQKWGRFVVLDIHSYNHRRDGPHAPPADPARNPELNIGTGTMDRERWAPVVDRAIAEFRGADFLGRKLDVRENVKFRGGEFSSWVHRSYPETGCALALEFKKFFMDECTGEGIEEQVVAIEKLVAGVIPALIEELATAR
jgi:N-formylglutamate deformylase